MHAALPISASSVRDLHADFSNRILPAVERIARQRFAKDRDRDEKVQAATCLTWKAFSALVEQGRQDRIFPSKLADFACRQVRDGRDLGTPINVNDVLSVACRRRHGHSVAGFGGTQDLAVELHDVLGEHNRATPADQAAFRIDFPTWLASLPTKARRIARLLMEGYATGYVARKVGVTPGRVSQLRRELHESWSHFHGEPVPAA